MRMLNDRGFVFVCLFVFTAKRVPNGRGKNAMQILKTIMADVRG